MYSCVKVRIRLNILHSLFSSHRHTLSVKISCLFSITNHDLCQSCNIRNITLHAYFNIRIHVHCKYDVFKARIKSSICEFQRKSINSTSTNLAFHKSLKLFFYIFLQSNKFHLKINICQEVVSFKCTRTNIKPKYDKLTNGTTGHYTLEQKVKLGLLIKHFWYHTELYEVLRCTYPANVKSFCFIVSM